MVGLDNSKRLQKFQKNLRRRVLYLGLAKKYCSLHIQIGLKRYLEVCGEFIKQSGWKILVVTTVYKNIILLS